MTDYPFDITSLTGDQADLLMDTYELLKENFEVFRHYDRVNVLGSFVIKDARTDCYILFLELDYTKATANRTGDAHHRDYQTWALAYLKHDFGRVMIRRETLADKIIELVHPVEIDFAEDKAFSDTFYVLANDFNKAYANMNRDFRNAVMDVRHDDFTIEIADHTLIIGDRKPVFPGRALHMAQFVARLCSMC
jgi:hypothetical protein